MNTVFVYLPWVLLLQERWWRNGSVGCYTTILTSSPHVFAYDFDYLRIHRMRMRMCIVNVCRIFVEYIRKCVTLNSAMHVRDVQHTYLMSFIFMLLRFASVRLSRMVSKWMERRWCNKQMDFLLNEIVFGSCDESCSCTHKLQWKFYAYWFSVSGIRYEIKEHFLCDTEYCSCLSWRNSVNCLGNISHLWKICICTGSHLERFNLYLWHKCIIFDTLNTKNLRTYEYSHTRKS